MQITGRDFGPVLLQAKGGIVVEAERPVRYMRGWELKRVVRLAERWHWQVALSDDERQQLGQEPPADPSARNSSGCDRSDKSADRPG